MTRNVLRPLTVRHWAWLHFKVAIVAWGIAYWAFTPAATVAALDIVFRFTWLGFTVIGASTSIVGLILGVQPFDLARKRGAQVELGGLSLMIVGPLVYFTTQLSLVINRTGPDPASRVGLVIFAYAMVAAVVARIVVVIPRYRLGLSDMTRSHDG